MHKVCNVTFTKPYIKRGTESNQNTIKLCAHLDEISVSVVWVFGEKMLIEGIESKADEREHVFLNFPFFVWNLFFVMSLRYQIIPDYNCMELSRGNFVKTLRCVFLFYDIKMPQRRTSTRSVIFPKSLSLFWTPFGPERRKMSSSVSIWIKY